MKGYIYYGAAILLGVLLGTSGGFVAAGGLNKDTSPRAEVSHQETFDQTKGLGSEEGLMPTLAPNLEDSKSKVSPSTSTKGIVQAAKEIPASATWVPGGDVNRDGEVNMKDLETVGAELGKGSTRAESRS